MDTFEYTQQTCCPVCEQPSAPLIALPRYPITELYVEWAPAFTPQGFIDQTVRYCHACNHAHLETVLDVRSVYRDYITASGASQGALLCLDGFGAFIERHVRIDDFGLMIDIGGNDSTFLGRYRERELRLVNIDPNASGDERYEKISCFLEDVDLQGYKGEARKLVVSSHTIEHLEHPSELIRKIAAALAPNDYCFMQFPSLERLVAHARFDQICHQHLNYFSLRSITALLLRHGLRVLDHEYDDGHFGTLRVAAALARDDTEARPTPGIDPETITAKHTRFARHHDDLNELIAATFAGGTGFGAGLMVPTLAYYLPVIDTLTRIVDDNPLKHGKRFINLRPQIVPVSAWSPDEPVLITSISTKSAARAIFNRLTALDAANVVLPTIMT